MRPEDIQRHIDNNTFMTVLMSHTVVTPHKHENGTLMFEMVFPDWYSRYISKGSRAQIEALVKTNAERAFRHARTSCDPTDDPTDPTDDLTR